jgi:FMN phosphatase YigB (HAD superfamily)
MLPEGLKAAPVMLGRPASHSTPPMPPAFIYLDLGNVVFFFDRDRSFARMAEVSGTDPATVHRVVMEEGLQAALERGEIGWPEFHAEFSHRTATRPDAAGLARAASDMFRLNAAMLPIIAGCRRAGVPLGILSNTCDPHWPFLVASGYAILPGGFREIVLSHEERSAKPDRAIYEVATARAGVPPERIFFCDDLEPHVAAARSVGWDAEVFTSAYRLADQLARRGLRLGV